MKSSTLFLFLLVLLNNNVLFRVNSQAIPPGKIKHFIYLIQENRSFDHFLGHLKATNPNINGLNGDEYNLANVNDANSTRYYVHTNQPYRTIDPPHGLNAITEQVFGTQDEPQPRPDVAPMNGFAQNSIRVYGTEQAAVDTMGYHLQERLPVTSFLAQEFALFDSWFCSVPASTQPNRMFVHSTTSNGMSNNDVPQLVRGLPQPPFLQNIVADGYTWSNYFEQVPAIALLQWPRRPANNYNFAAYNHYSKFKEDAASGNLANVIVLDPRYGDGREGYLQDDFHPGGSDIVSSEALIKDIYETLRASPVWNETMFLYTFDEHGGYYDHEPTPLHVPSPDGKCNDYIDGEFCFDRLGVRVPTIVVSPWINKGTVVHEPPPANRPTETSAYEHSSVSATLKAMWNLTSDFLTERDRWAGTFHHLLDQRNEPRTDAPMFAPDLPDPDLSYYSPNNPIGDLQRDFIIMSAALIGEEEKMTEEFLSSMTEIQADSYMKRAMTKWLGRCIYPPEEYEC